MYKFFKENPTVVLALITVVVCSFRFLLDGISFKAFGQMISLPHTDPLAYGSILAPVLGAHGYVHGKNKEFDIKGEDKDAN